MALTTLKDRVKAAGSRTASVLDDETTHERTADGGDEPGREHADDATVGAWLDRFDADVTAALPRHVDGRVFLAALRPQLPKLLGRCTPASVLQSAVTCARFGLIPDGQQAVIVPDGRIAVFIATYRGFIDLMYRSGLVRSVVAGMVYEGDEWTYEPTAPAPLDFTHRPNVLATKEHRGRPLFAYAFVWLEGGVRSAVAIVTREQAEETRDEHSRAYQRAEESGKRDSFWHLRFDDMWLKTALRRAERLVPTSAELRALVAVEQAAEDGRPQILASVDPETAALDAAARRAARAAEGSQEPRRVPSKPSSKRGRAKPRRRNRDKKTRR
ncbi:RecT family recombinase [Streptomyces sp. BSE6.1]|uniref:RecT family recombinase n=1 Tax=Streptomyces sp. BSE6.1 TaxID=2605730 RepID=UPI001F245737|nr:RecT family recombinase [Streptomyces sp. BSE6.1]